MTAQEQATPTPCYAGHVPAFEITYRVPDMFRKYWGFPETQTKHVCTECYNTIPAFQDDIMGPIKHLDGTEVKSVA